jgi:anti-sigma B factor antagonist
METEILNENSTAIWRLRDELEDPNLLKGPMAEFKASGLRCMLLDLEEKEWLSSSEIGVVMWIFKELDGSGAELSLLAVSPFIMKTIKVTGIDQLLSVYESRADALEKINNQV